MTNWLGANIRRVRKEKGVSQQFINRKIGRGKSWLCRVESGAIDIKASELKKIADALELRDIGVFYLLTAQKNVAPKKEIITMTGQKMNIPREIKKIYSPSLLSTVVIYTLNPDLLVGLNNTAVNKKHFGEKYRDLPVLGGLFAGINTINSESVIKCYPDIIVTTSTMSANHFGGVIGADRLQEEFGVPVLVLTNELDEMAGLYEFLGDLVGQKERAHELGDYCRRVISETRMMVANVPQDKRIRVYYAEGPEGLATDPTGSRHSEVLDFVGGFNVADVQITPGIGMTEVSLENIIAWDPDVIIANSEEFLNKVMKNEKWEGLKAVKNGQIYGIPSDPFNWIDRPPSVNRIIGVRWLANLLYPEFVSLDIKAETKEFYEKFYHHKLSDAEVDELLRNSIRK